MAVTLSSVGGSLFLARNKNQHFVLSIVLERRLLALILNNVIWRHAFWRQGEFEMTVT